MEFEHVDVHVLESLAELLRDPEATRVGVSSQPASGDNDSVPVGSETAGGLVAEPRESWADKVARIRASSPHGSKRGFSVETVIVKSFDDLRQEAFIMQLIREMDAVWRRCKVPMAIFPYKILATSASGGLIQGLPDALSLDAVKKQCVDKGLGSLRSFFVAKYGKESSAAFKLAQRHFMRSLAGYSLVCYMLQLKDRHNGNILLHDSGHLIHIDFGFVLGMSPGNLAFESSPFKLTDEYVALLDGVGSELWHEFVRCLQKGFLALRQHHHCLTALVEMAVFANQLPFCQRHAGSSSSYPIAGLLKRLELHASDAQCRAKMQKLALSAAKSWSTAQYDNYQKLVNNIQP